MRVVVTGVLLPKGKAFELCPGKRGVNCPGIELAGPVDPTLVSTSKSAVVVRVLGTYDGRSLTNVEGIERTELGSEPDWKNPCPEFQTRLPPDRSYGPNASLAHSERTARFVDNHRERLAGQWWDRERRTMTVWFAGDVTALERELKSSAPGERICLFGGARFSERELLAAAERVDAVAREQELVRSGWYLDVFTNRVLYELDAADGKTLQRLRSAGGPGVHVVSFLELRDEPLAALPRVQLAGNIPLETTKSRVGMHMQALGSFRIGFDPRERCVFLLDDAGRRLLPVWPFGYSARSSPAETEILDYDGNVVAREGRRQAFGGGHVDLAFAVRTNCGAKDAWVGYPTTEQPRR